VDTRRHLELVSRGALSIDTGELGAIDMDERQLGHGASRRRVHPRRAAQQADDSSRNAPAHPRSL
jgi:hypothetical protein